MPKIEDVLLILADGLVADPTEDARMSEAVLRNAVGQLRALRTSLAASELARAQATVRAEAAEAALAARR